MVLPPIPTLNSAIELKEAVDNAPKYLKPIGFCPSVLNSRQIDLRVKKDPYSKKAMSWRHKTESYKDLMKQLRKIEEQYISPCAKGYLDVPFALTITRQGCEFSGNISPKNQGRKEEVAARLKDMKKLLKRWFESGTVSGYGEMRTQQTKISKSVRDAREIPASEFSVEPQFLESIKKHWAAHFYPTMVRVEPYKIHLYGPGGKFAKHRDTPEADLVGTFLVGLGNFGKGGGLSVKGLNGWQSYKSHPGSWVTFHPDVHHEVIKIKKGYRAVIAFKVFRLSGVQEDPADSIVRSKIRDIFEKMPPKFGMLFERSYCKGTTKLSGFDAQLLAAAKSMSRADTFVLPVLTDLDVEVFDYNRHEEWVDYYNKMTAMVYPLTEPHVNALITFARRNRTENEEKQEDNLDMKDNSDKEDNMTKEDNLDKEAGSDKEDEEDYLEEEEYLDDDDFLAEYSIYERDSSDEEDISDEEDEEDISNEEDSSDEKNKMNEEDNSHKDNNFFGDFLMGTEAAWIKEHGVGNVPFFSQDVEGSVVLWHQKAENGVEYIGNEGKPSSEDSVYISYAMVVLPKAGTKRKRENSQEPTGN